ncbi:MAG: transposase [Candidatus Pacebacteria bacterium]|nr:transposase [Candidatus Paceibacterota bacterium]
MPRQPRNAHGGYIYHVLNRANARLPIFETDKDYRLFENILEEAKEREDVSVLAYCLMPNHWHLVLLPKTGGALPSFMKWLTNTHTKRWHAARSTTGQGHLYQGRYKSFICEEDDYFLTLVRYVERNAKKANLVKKAEDWKWSSVWSREKGTPEQKKLLSPWPISEPRNYLTWLNEAQTQVEEDAIEVSIERDRPFGTDDWLTKIVRKFGLESTLRPRGRPKKGD